MSYLDNLLASGERIVHRTRRHVIVLTRTVGAALVVVAAGLGLAAFFGFWSGMPNAGNYAAWGGVGLAVVGALAAFPAWLRWRCEEYLITDRRVIQVEGVFRKQVLDSSLDKVNDVLLKQSLVGRMFGYGTIEILTASEHGINRLDTLPDPLGFKRAMLEARGGGPVAPTPSPARNEAGAAERLAQLDEMRRRKLVSEDEYQAKRRDILSGL